MRNTILRTLWAVAVAAVVTGVGACAALQQPAPGIDVYFRNAELGAVSDQPLPQFSAPEAGESETIARAFNGAPPPIPHTVIDMLPLTLDDNECLECHHPENVTRKEDAPLTKEHFDSPVLVRRSTGMVWVVKNYEKAETVGGRFDCVMCHVPQANNVKDIRNLFHSSD